jgi:hypothetical protein
MGPRFAFFVQELNRFTPAQLRFPAKAGTHFSTRAAPIS